MAHPFQTTVQNVNAVRFGSAQVSITATLGDTSGATYTDLGVAQGVTFADWNLSKSGTENKLVTFQVPYTVSNTTKTNYGV